MFDNTAKECLCIVRHLRNGEARREGLRNHHRCYKDEEYVSDVSYVWVVDCSMSGLLLKRVEALETVLANSPGDSTDVFAVLDGLRTSLQERTSVQSLQDALNACDVYVEKNDGNGEGVADSDSEIESEMTFEEQKTVVLAHYKQFSSVVTTTESILSDYYDVLERYRSAVNKTPQLNMQVVLQKYKQIELKFIANLKRMLILLEKYAILRHEQSKLMSS